MAPDPTQTSASSTTVTLPHRERPGAPLKDVLLDRYVTRDWLHSLALVSQMQREKAVLDRKYGELEDYKVVRNNRQAFPPSRLYGEGYNGYGNGHTDNKTGLLYPVHKPRLGKRKTPLLRVKRKDALQQADQVEELVPIRLDVDWDKIKLRDTFTWNIHDRIVTPKLFAEQLVEDFGLEPPAANVVYDQVFRQMCEQIGEFCPPVYFEEDALDPELPYSAYKNDEMRVLIKLNITIGQHTLVDQFEWEINNPMNSPEEFALSMARDLSLSGEFTTAIAHCIREQSQLFTRSLYIIGHPFDGRPVEDADLVAAFLPSPLISAFRPYQQAKDYAPYLYELNDADLERNEVIFSREQRRQKRSVNRRGGPTLPDLKERQRTVRTLIISSVLPGAALTVEDSRMYKRSGGGGGRGKKSQKDGFEISDSEESEDSSPDSPALSQLQGTARTRGMRGAAVSAQQRMANIGRSLTPEAAILHHHETRTSARRFGGRDAREESADGSSLIVTLKIGKEKFRQYLKDRKNGVRPKTLQSVPYSHNRSASAISGQGTPAPAGSMGPPLTPNVQNQPLAAPPANNLPPGQLGRVDAPPPARPGETQPTPPPPPSWLSVGLSDLLTTYPNDNFEGMMRYSAIDTRTDSPTAIPPAPSATDANSQTAPAIPPHIKFVYLPRIRCHDCPGKLYTPGPGMTVENFEVHLKNRLHREKVDGRVARTF